MDSFERLTQLKKDTRFETWNVRSPYRAGSFVRVASEIAKYDLDPVAVQEVRWLEDGSQPADEYTFFFTTCKLSKILLV
jgi:hypothetical protein